MSKATDDRDREGSKSRQKRVTARDVAVAAGVSRSAVSRAFTPGAYLQKDKRDRVLEAARKLGYRPNALAASLRGTRSGLVGVISGNLENAYDAELTARLLDRLNRLGWLPITIADPDRSSDQQLHSILNYPLDALIVRGGSVDPDFVQACIKLKIPLILSGYAHPAPGIDTVSCRNAMGTELAVSFLCSERNRRRIAYIGGPEGWASDNERLLGVRAQLRKEGLDLTARHHGDFTFEAGMAAAQDILQHYKVDAIVCANDAMALGALVHVRENTSLSVPQDLSIIGFDDVSMASWPCFDLTTIGNPRDATVDAIIDLLRSRVEQPGRDGETILIDPVLIKRSTH